MKALVILQPHRSKTIESRAVKYNCCTTTQVRINGSRVRKRLSYCTSHVESGPIKAELGKDSMYNYLGSESMDVSQGKNQLLYSHVARTGRKYCRIRKRLICYKAPQSQGQQMQSKVKDSASWTISQNQYDIGAHCAGDVHLLVGVARIQEALGNLALSAKYYKDSSPSSLSVRPLGFHLETQERFLRYCSQCYLVHRNQELYW